MMNDTMLRQAAAISAERFMASAARGYDPADAWTPPPRFVRKITRLTRRADHPHAYRALRRAASLILAALLTGAAWLAVDGEARAAFTAWVREVYENSVIYEFFGERDPAPVPEYVLTALPEGFVETDFVDNETIFVRIYTRGEETIVFTYMTMEGNTTVGVFSKDGFAREEVYVGDCKGDFYEDANPAESNGLIWMDENKQVIYQISAFLEKDQMLALAESVVKK